MNDLILYTTEDGRSQIKLRAKDESVWLTQLEMAELFASSKQNIGQHLKSIFEEGELMEASVVKQHFTTAADGKDYSTKLYNLDAILAVGYRVRSPRGVQFRRWASTILKEYLIKGFVMDDERLKNPDGRPASRCWLTRDRSAMNRWRPRQAPFISITTDAGRPRKHRPPIRRTKPTSKRSKPKSNAVPRND